MITSVLLDSNLLLLHVVGAHSRKAISKIRRLQAYSATDFDLLADLLQNSSGIVLTPNTITEVSNLLHTGDHTPEIEGATRQLAFLIERFGESYVESATVMTASNVIRLGVTDCILLTLARTGAILLTADLDLWASAQKAKQHVINFNHYRDGAS